MSAPANQETAQLRVVTRMTSYRKATEDRAAVLHVGGGVVVVVADGAGGMPGGGPAAQRIVDLVSNVAGPASGSEACGCQYWIDLLTWADRNLEMNEPCGETTAVVAAIRPDGLVGASCGDSAALLVRVDGELVDLTIDQQRKRLGSGHAQPVGWLTSFGAGDTLMVATDGLLSYAPVALVADRMRGSDLEQAAGELVELVRPVSGVLRDDVALVMVRRG